MNRIAEVLDLDPLQIRLKNANRIGDTTANRITLKTLRQCRRPRRS